jgi:hypothetical protein
MSERPGTAKNGQLAIRSAGKWPEIEDRDAMSFWFGQLAS